VDETSTLIAAPGANHRCGINYPAKPSYCHDSEVAVTTAKAHPRRAGGPRSSKRAVSRRSDDLQLLGGEETESEQGGEH
jgi:hypothetical protein